ncbi:MAG: molybdenum cofactor biosynthesis protein MoaE [Armatimonadetes bacterium]|nr:molybdenum cofactor biosynthesis protein MoaE [Armatimonadota bacterium]
MTRFELTERPIDVLALLASVEQSQAGAVSLFVGAVRDHNESKAVLRLQYEAYPEMACRVCEQILADALARFDIVKAVAVHRTGMLEVGEAAVAIAVSAAHRDAAFRACRFIIDSIKESAPIWKKEFYADSARWVVCHSHNAAESVL